MKILFVTDLFPIANDDEPHTLESFVYNWIQNGHEVDVLKSNFVLNSFLRGKNVHAEKLYLSKKGIHIFNLNYFTPFLFNVFDKFDENIDIGSYDVLISHMPAGALLAGRIHEKASGLKWINAVHSSDIEVLTNPLYKHYFAQKLKECYLKANKISARSFVLEKRIQEIIPESHGKTFCAFSGIEEHEILEKAEFERKVDKILSSETLKITSVSKLIKRKNIDIILKALAEIKNFDWQYNIIGTGKELNRLKELTTQLGIKDKVTFLGAKTHHKTLQALKDSDIFVLLSEKETFGLSYLEAMAKANLVIATKDDGIDGIIKNNNNGYLIEPTKNALINKLKKIKSLSKIELADIMLNSHYTICQHTSKIAAENYLINIQ